MLRSWIFRDGWVDRIIRSFAADVSTQSLPHFQVASYASRSGPDQALACEDDVKQLNRRLLNLPAEIRLNTYSYLFEDSIIYVTATNNCSVCAGRMPKGPYTKSQEWLLKPGRAKLRQEALPIFLASTLWIFHCASALDHFIRRLRKLKIRRNDYLNCIKRFQVGVGGWAPGLPWDPSLHLLPNLKEVTISAWETTNLPVMIVREDPIDQPDDAATARECFQIIDQWLTLYGRRLVSLKGRATIKFLLLVRYQHGPPDIPSLHQLEETVWCANLSTGVIHRKCSNPSPFYDGDL